MRSKFILVTFRKITSLGPNLWLLQKSQLLAQTCDLFVKNLWPFVKVTTLERSQLWVKVTSLNRKVTSLGQKVRLLQKSQVWAQTCDFSKGHKFGPKLVTFLNNWELLRNPASLGPNLWTLWNPASLNLQGFKTLQVWAQTCEVS